MKHTLPRLPYTLDALEPYISKETLEYHHGKHHKAYVDKLNELIPGTEFADMTLEEIIANAPKGPIYNNAAQVWNHTFYFENLTPDSSEKPTEKILAEIEKKWNSFEEFQEEFNKKAIGNFGSGWTWLAKSGDSLEIINTDDAESLAVDKKNVPLLTCDVWEHAYYIDTRNARPKYLENFWKVVNWKEVEKRFENTKK